MGLGDSIRKLSHSLGITKAEKAKAESLGKNVSENEESSEDELDLERLQESESDSELGSDSSEEEEEEEDNDNDNDDEEDADVALSDAELDDDADVVPYQKMTINNIGALKKSLKSIELPQSAKANFVEHLTVSSEEDIVLRDIYDDTERELAFYKQALAAAYEGRKRCKQADIPFTRPMDYFAEMVKSDEHMARVKTKLVQDEKQKIASQEARKQRELKKYGKKVQHEKLQQRSKEKREMLDKVNSLKRKRANTDQDDDQFDVQLEDAIGDKREARDEKYKLGNKKQPNRKRLAKNQRYGSGYKRGDRKNTAESSMDISGFKHKKSRRK